VRCAGIAAVGISPEARGGGAGIALMSGTLGVARERGFALSTLFMTSMAPYRRSGYELAGARVRFAAPLTTVPRSAGYSVEPWTDEDLDDVMGCYRRYAEQSAGLLDRPPWWWGPRVLGVDDDTFLYRYLVRRDGEVRGYVVFTQHPEPGHLPDQWVPGDEQPFALATRDFVWLDLDAAQSLLALAAGHWSLGTNLYWTGPYDDPLRMLFRDRLPAVDTSYAWMTRIVDVVAALEARGYPHDVEASVSFDVTDELLPDNSGGYRLQVAGGKATVERGGATKVSITVHGLAAMYTGWLRPVDAVRTGHLVGASPTDLAAFTSAFAGPSPWMPDFF
jgi:predicted acetyltransferase